jgi:hypothetical protein
MESYPRTKIWPLALLILLLFSLTAAAPRIWRARQAAQVEQLRAEARKHLEVASRASSTEDCALVPVSAEAVARSGIRAEVRPEGRTSRRVIVEPSEVASEQPVTSRTIPGLASRPAIPPFTQPANHVQAPVGAEPVRMGDANEAPPAVAGKSDDLADWLELEADELAVTLPEEPPAAPEAAGEARVPPGCWPRPTSLLALLDALPATNAVGLNSWVRSTRESLDRLAQVARLDHPQVAVELNRLHDLASQIPSLESSVNREDGVLLRRIGYGIERRLAIWQAVHQLARHSPAAAAPEAADVVAALTAVRRQLAASPATSDSWQAYLMLDRLDELASASWQTDAEVRRTTARQVLDRIAGADLTAEQKQYLQTRTMANLTVALGTWAYEPVDASALMRIVEQFESSRSGKLAAEVVAIREALRWHPAPEAETLRQNLDAHYRNANIRLAISGELINELLPVLQPIQEQVRDNILGAEVLGQNRTWANLRVSLIDDDRCIRLRFEADGQTRSQTVSIVGPVRFYNRGQGRFQADKDLMITPDGIFVQRATAAADGRAELINVETDYDRIPLLGWILRQVALDEHDEQRPVVRQEFRQRISRSATRRLDDSVHEHLTGAEQRVDAKVLGPLRKLQLDPQALEMRTTADRIVLRSRIASPTQLAGYTPRPRAQQESLLSLQVHESAANNLLQQLNLEGRRIDMQELMVCLSEKLHIDRTDIHEELPEDAVVRLGYDRPIEVEFDNDHVLLTVRIAELSTGKRTWRNFVVRGRYRADVTRLSVDLSREGGIELISDEIGFRDQIALRGIFTKVMTRNHRLNLLRDRFVEDRRLASLSVTQFVVRDGWIGVSVSPNSRDKVATEQPPRTR